MNKLYMLKNNNGEVKNYSKLDTKEFQRLNLEGWNVYESVNSFFLSGRKEKDLGKFEAIGIDLDTGVENKFASYKELLAYIEERIGIHPTKVNETYKGYHIFFDLEKELNYLTLDSYKELYNFMNKKLEGDYKMVGTTGVLKIEGYIDNKEGRNFDIITIYKNSKNIISKSYLNDIGIEAIFRKEDSVIHKDIKKNRNQNDIENVDGLEFINKINELFNKKNYLFKKEVNLIKNSDSLYSIDSTDGLKLQFNKDKGKWEFCDYSLRTRSGIGKFIYNYYAKDDLPEIKHSIYRTITKEFGIVLQKGINNISMPLNVSIGLDKKEYKRDNKDIEHIEGKEFIQDIEKLIEASNKTILSDYSLMKLLVGILSCANLKEVSNGKYLAGENDLIELFGKKTFDSTKKTIRTMFIELSKLVIPTQVSFEIQEEKYKGIELKKLFDIGFVTNQKGKIFYTLKINIPFNKQIYINKESLKLDGDIQESKQFGFLSHIQLQILHQKHGGCTLTMEEINNILEFKTDKKQIKFKIKAILEKFKAKSLIQGFECEKDIFKIW